MNKVQQSQLVIFTSCSDNGNTGCEESDWSSKQIRGNLLVFEMSCGQHPSLLSVSLHMLPTPQGLCLNINLGVH